MKTISRPFLIGVLLLILLSSSCNLPVQTAAPMGTILPNGATQTIATSSEVLVGSSTPLTPIIPITGENVVEMQCQFCVNDQPHAVLIFPDFAIFDVDTLASAPVTCLTAEVLNGKRVLVCSGTQLTTFNLKICSDPSNCLLFPVALQGCPLQGAGNTSVTVTPMTPIFLTAINTLNPPSATRQGGTPIPSQGATQTSTQGSGPTPTPTLALPTPTSILPPTSTSEPPTPAPTDTVAATQPPTSEPASTPTPQPSSTDNQKPTKTPKH